MNAKDATREELEAFFNVYATCTNCKYCYADETVECFYPADPIGALFVIPKDDMKRSEVHGMERCDHWESHYIGGCKEVADKITVGACPNE